MMSHCLTGRKLRWATWRMHSTRPVMPVDNTGRVFSGIWRDRSRRPVQQIVPWVECINAIKCYLYCWKGIITVPLLVILCENPCRNGGEIAS